MKQIHGKMYGKQKSGELILGRSIILRSYLHTDSFRKL